MLSGPVFFLTFILYKHGTVSMEPVFLLTCILISGTKHHNECAALFRLSNVASSEYIVHVIRCKK